MPDMNARKINGAYAIVGSHYCRILEAWGDNVVKFCTDFTALPTDDTTGDPTEWTMTVTEAGAGTTTAVLDTTNGGNLLITTAANEYDGINLQLKGEAFQLVVGKPLYFGTRLKVSDATQSDLLVGLAVTDTTLMAVDTAHASSCQDAICFLSLDAATTVHAITDKDASETTTTTSLLTLDTSFHWYEFWWDGVATVKLFIDGTENAQTLSGANLIDNEVLTPSINFRAGAAAAKTLTIDKLNVFMFNT